MLSREKVAHHKNLLQKGTADLGLVISSIQQGFLLWLVLRDLFPAMPRRWIIPVVAGCVIVITAAKWIYGWLYEKTGLFTEELTWLARRNRDLQEIRKQYAPPDDD